MQELKDKIEIIKNSEDLNFVNYKVGVLRQDTWKKIKVCKWC